MDGGRDVFFKEDYMEEGASMNLKVLELPSWYLPQGGHFVRHQALALKEHGVEVSILANVTMPWREYMLHPFDGKYPLRHFFTEEDGIPILRNYFRPIPKSEIINIRLWAKRAADLYDLYVSHYGHPDLIHVHSSTWGAYAASLIKAKHHVPYVVTEHRGMYSCLCQMARNFFKPEYEYFLREGLSNADYIIPVGDLLIPKIREYLTHDVPIRIVSNIVDTDFFVPNKSISKPHHPFRWISVNGFYAVKGYDVLLPAFDQLCDNGADVTLTLVGENFEQREFQELLLNCRYRDRIRFTGELTRDGVRHELQNADAFVMSSRVEAQPVAILEAIGCGLPVAGTEVIPPYSLPEYLGVRVPVERADLLTAAMQHIMNHYANYSPEDANCHVVSIANKDTVCRQLIDIYQAVINRY